MSQILKKKLSNGIEMPYIGLGTFKVNGCFKGIRICIVLMMMIII
jgi:diketogulonate reductase-like aldo/keto reductase